MTASNIYVIIVAGGSGKRMSSSLPKQFLSVNGTPIIVHTINKFDKALEDFNLIVVMNPEWIGYWDELAQKFDVRTHTVVEGGAERFFSVKNALNSISDTSNDAVVLIHDAVRPLVDEETIRNVVNQSGEKGCSIPVVPVSQSLREKSGDGFSRPVDRNNFIVVQTPQGFNLAKIKDAYNLGYKKIFTDDATVFEAAGNELFYTEGKSFNLKITYPEDILLAGCLLGE